jgi:sec-independent protein translocase protein TatB
MNFFGVGPMEAIVIMVIALVIFGPGRLPEMMAEAGRMVRELRRMTRDITSEFDDSIREVRTTVTDVQQSVKDAQKDTRDFANSVATSVSDAAKLDGVVLSESHAKRPSAANRQFATPSQLKQEQAARAKASTVPAGPAPSKDDPLADIVGLDEDSDSSVLPEKPPASS